MNSKSNRAITPHPTLSTTPPTLPVGAPFARPHSMSTALPPLPPLLSARVATALQEPWPSSHPSLPAHSPTCFIKVAPTLHQHLPVRRQMLGHADWPRRKAAAATLQRGRGNCRGRRPSPCGCGTALLHGLGRKVAIEWPGAAQLGAWRSWVCCGVGSGRGAYGHALGRGHAQGMRSKASMFEGARSWVLACSQSRHGPRAGMQPERACSKSGHAKGWGRGEQQPEAR